MWERIVGSEFADRLEFKVPLAEGSGTGVVFHRVRKERPTNSKIFGLVDGEEAARFGQVDRLIDCSAVLFELDSAEFNGIVFLGACELENVLIGHSDFAAFVERNVELRELGVRNIEEVEKDVSKQAKRFYVAALIKYSWAHLYFRGLAVGIGNVDHFRSEHGLMVEIRRAKERIVREFADDGQEFRRQFVEIGRWAKLASG